MGRHILLQFRRKIKDKEDTSCTDYLKKDKIKKSIAVELTVSFIISFASIFHTQRSGCREGPGHIIFDFFHTKIKFSAYL